MGGNEQTPVILVVEDSPTQAMRLQYSLEGGGYRVELARDGREGLDKALDLSADLVISDINMPRMDGFQMCRELKGNPDTSQVPVLLLTKFSDPEHIIKGLQAGADCHINKPYDEQTLLDKTAQMLADRTGPGEGAADSPPAVMVDGNQEFIQAPPGKILSFLMDTCQYALGQNSCLRQAEASLQNLNQDLEQTVARRTRQLSQAAQEWRDCFDSLEDMMMLVDENYRVVRANMAVSRRLGLSFEQILGQPCHRVVHGLDKPHPHCPRNQVLAKGQNSQMEFDEPHLGLRAQITVSVVNDEGGRPARTVHVIKDVTEQRRRERETERLNQVLADAFSGVTQAMSDLAANQDPYTAGHARGVADFAVKIAQEMGIGQAEMRGLWVCAILHDIGKAVIPPGILNKPGDLSSHEMGIIRDHPTTAFEVLKKIPFPWPVAQVVQQHHERIDARGYPFGLEEGNIHPWSKILAVADTMDAMINHRPYRAALPMKDVVRVLEGGKGTSFDPQVVDVGLGLLAQKARRVLLVDDDAGVATALREGLRNAGYAADAYQAPRAALEAFRLQPYPVVITDLKMPGMDGLELLRQLRQMAPECQVIIITGMAGKDIVKEALHLGARDFLEKPLKMQEVIRAVARALEAS